MFEEFKGTGIPIPTPKKPSGDFLKKLPKIVLIVVIVLVLLAAVASSWYTVNDKEQAVVTTFGKVTDITDAGFHFKLPFGIQKVEKVNVNVYQKIELGYRSVGSADNFDIIESETKMITGDYNIVDVEFFVEYKVSDPEKYLYGSYDPETILRNLLQSQVRNVVGSEAVRSVQFTSCIFILSQAMRWLMLFLKCTSYASKCGRVRTFVHKFLQNSARKKPLHSSSLPSK